MHTPSCGVIFDLDGTLINSLEDLADAANAALAGFGYPVHRLDAYRHFVGNGLETLMRRALPAGEAERLGPGFAAVLDAVREIYGNAWDVKTVPYPDVSDLPAELAAYGIPSSVLSNKPDPWTGAVVRRFFPDAPFVTVRGALPGVPLKPDPTAALHTAAEMGLAADRLFLVGDSDVDILTAVRAGMFAVGVTWGFRDAQELREAGARAVIDKPEELLPLVLRSLTRSAPLPRKRP